jgi:hypothetical protein
MCIGYGPTPRVRTHAVPLARSASQTLQAYMHGKVTHFFLYASNVTMHFFQLYTLMLNTKCNYKFYALREESDQIVFAYSG